MKKIIPCIIVLMLFSCTPKKEIIYFQNIDSLPSQKSNSYEIKIQPDDLLLIIVSAADVESAIPFNLTAVSSASIARQDAIGQQAPQLYLVDTNGCIDFPVLGNLKVGGLSRSEMMKLLKDKIGTYIKNPTINFRIMNFKVTVQGEVTAPGTYSFTSERITLIEALSMAHDLTVYGKRNNILIIREIEGVKTYNRVDITKADFMNSAFYYLAQNDVVYVEPNQNKINGAAIGSNTGVIISVSSLTITVIALLISIFK